MSDQITVRLRHPNLGYDRGDEVDLDAAEAVLWCRRGLAEPVDAEDFAERAAQAPPAPQMAAHEPPEAPAVRFPPGAQIPRLPGP